MARKFKDFVPRPKPRNDQEFTKKIKTNKRSVASKNIIDKEDHNGKNTRRN